mmetsp:Transcript_16041/g.49048  ORF Transcript_16041/g.49048 Transcript_16041/m.49048 type:complete len:315 (+) Transcript_16041:409-1353(+)
MRPRVVEMAAVSSGEEQPHGGSEERGALRMAALALRVRTQPLAPRALPVLRPAAVLRAIPAPILGIKPGRGLRAQHASGAVERACFSGIHLEDLVRVAGEGKQPRLRVCHPLVEVDELGGWSEDVSLGPPPEMVGGRKAQPLARQRVEAQWNRVVDLALGKAHRRSVGHAHGEGQGRRGALAERREAEDVGRDELEPRHVVVLDLPPWRPIAPSPRGDVHLVVPWNATKGHHTRKPAQKGAVHHHCAGREAGAVAHKLDRLEGAGTHAVPVGARQCYAPHGVALVGAGKVAEERGEAAFPATAVIGPEFARVVV